MVVVEEGVLVVPASGMVALVACPVGESSDRPDPFPLVEVEAH
jgi:hypothetical protein